MGLPGRRLPLPARWAARAPVLRRVLRAAAAAVLPVMLLAEPAAAQTSPSGGAGEPETPRIAAGTHYVMIAPADGGYRVAETIQLRNTSGTAVDDVTLPLFAGAWDVQFLAGFDEAQVSVVPGAVQVQRRLPPGEDAAFTLAYRLTTQDLPLALVRPIAFPTERVVVLVPVDAPFTPAAGGLNLRGVDTISGQDVRVYDAGAVAPVDEWILGLVPVGTPPWEEARVPVIDHNRSLQGAWRPVGLGFALMALWAVGQRLARAVRLRGVGLPRFEAWMEAADSLAPSERRRLADQVAEAAANLERARGRLTDAVYRREREALLAAWKHLHPDDREAAPAAVEEAGP